ncbi:ribonuclease E/G [Gracilibacillus sp. YIM 98692]|uniref:ribonuclease E/G n=1 Tax=Gracilibacillus sp. YIM 98692 TaxID=2663532 RepID=UPI0013D8DF5E|nr:ribonuclease E/G [Gracilibacillus sp. YIM 98692]
MGILYFQTKLSEKVGLYIENQKVKDIQIDRELNNGENVGSIYLGKVRNVDEQVEAAFIDIGGKKVGFLPKREIPPSKLNGRRWSSVLTEGADIIVQIVKESYQDKGPKLTANIALPGTSLVYLPFSDYIACSKKILSRKRHELEVSTAPLLSYPEGVILRTNSAELTLAELQQELVSQREKWESYLHWAEIKSPPACLYRQSVIPEQMLNQYQHKPLDNIIFDQPKVMKSSKQLFPQLAIRMESKQQMPQIEEGDLDQLFDQLLSPLVKTKEGLCLMIEQTEGLTVIDIDSSQFKSKQSKQRTVLEINQKAAKYCADEIRRRNIAGIIVIDFLKMRKKEDQEKVINALKTAFGDDPIRSEIYGFTKLGLIELTRKRERASILELFTKPRISIERTVESFAYQLERELFELDQTQTEAVMIACHPILLDYLKQNIWPTLKEIISLTVLVKKDKSIHYYEWIRSGSENLIQDSLEDKSFQEIDNIR